MIRNDDSIPPNPTRTALASDASKTYFDLGHVFDDMPRREAVAWLRDFEREARPPIWLQRLHWWMRAHRDWRFLAFHDEEWSDVALAKDKDVKSRLVHEYGESRPILLEEGSLFERMEKQ